MAVYQFSALSDGQAISFDPNADVLRFDQGSISAADVRVIVEGADLRLAVFGKDVLLLGVAPAETTPGNIRFDNGSRFVIGDSMPTQAGDNSGQVLFGFETADYLWGLGGNDTLGGAGGDDWLAGGSGQDVIRGFDGADSFVFREPASNSNFDRILDFVSGTDKLLFHEDVFGDVTRPGRIVYDSSNGFLYFDADGSGAGRAQLVAILQGAPTLAAADIGTFNDEAPGGGGGATEGDDTLVGTPGNDSIDGLGGNDLIQTLGGNDTLRGGAGADTLEGGAGDDVYQVDHNGDVLIDSGGIDTIVAPGDWALAAGFENLIVTGPPNSVDGTIWVSGNELGNVIIDQAGGYVFFFGGGGDDTLIGSDGPNFFEFGTGHGNDSVDGGGGEDELWFGTAVTVDFRDGTATSPFGTIVFVNIDSARGSQDADLMLADDLGRSLEGYDGDDTVIGGAGDDGLNGGGILWDTPMEESGGDDLVLGNGGNDTLYGEAGDDTLNGGEGNDSLTGDGGPSAGLDVFVFDQPAGAANADVIMGFGYGGVRDELHLDNAAMPTLGAAGRFSAGDARFFAGAGANAGQDASDRVVYNTTTGQLWYDADGSGAGAALLIATLEGAPSLQATDIVVIGDGPSPITGTEGDDSLTGTTGDDTIYGLGGDDTIDGTGGADELYGGEGNDYVFGGLSDPFTPEGGNLLVGGDGNDTLDGENGGFADSDPNVDTMDGGLGDDEFHVDNVADVLSDAGGLDTVHSDTVDWTLGAGFENLVLNNGETEWFLTGIGNGLDNVMRGGWNVRFEGRGGNDTLLGSAQEDILLGEEGDDLIDGGAHDDSVDGGAGNDTLIGGQPYADGDTMTGGGGADVFDLAGGGKLVTDFGSAVDALQLDGDYFTGVGASGRFAAGDERFHAAAGVSAGHDATDRLVYDTASGTLYYDPDGAGGEQAWLVGRLEGAPTLTDTDIVVVDGAPSGAVIDGTAANDSLAGTTGDDTLRGLAGRDTLNGGAGDDWLEGGAGIDSLTGSAGEDSFVFREAPANSNFDRLLDFTSSTDTLRFDDTVYTQLGTPGDFGAGDDRFFAGAGARSGVDAEDRLIYDTSSGFLWYDADGSGSGGQLFVAVVQGAPALSAGDIAVI